MIRRSYLYVPGDDLSKLDKAPTRGADALIVDLEDAVAPQAKDAAREIVGSWLSEVASRAVPELWVRVNAGGALEADLRAVVGPGLYGVVVPKASGSVLNRLADRLTELEVASGLEPGSVAVFALVESAGGVQEVEAIATAPRVMRVALGEADLAADLGVARSEPLAWASLRSRVVVACAAAGIAPPVGSTSLDFGDLDALRSSTEELKRLGFRGRTAIHPAQVPVINEVFTPSIGEVEEARRLVDRFDAAVAAGRGVALDEHGRMIDEAVVRSARQVLDLAASAGL